ncbi:MAG: PilZ domain-containing protein [Deltaproteobacteria bacterium]
MRRLLIVAGDRELTRFIAEAMLGRSASEPPRPDDTWDVARAHTGLEGLTLVEYGGRPFDCVLLGTGLPDQEVLDVVAKMRTLDVTKDVPMFLIVERGRDVHSRRIATERHQVAGFLEKPVTADALRQTFEGLERKRRILLVESREDTSDRYAESLKKAGYAVEAVATGRAALDRVPRLAPDLVVAALTLDDARGVDVCVDLKKAATKAPVRVVLYGQVSALANTEITENAHRADDFVQAPFDDELLVERVGMLIGRGGKEKPRARRRSVRGIDIDLDRTEDKTEQGMYAVEGTSPGDREAPGEPKSPGAPPPSASPAPSGPARRSTRRVPCNISMRVVGGGRTHTSKTLDISHGGIFLATEETPEIGTRLEMTFQIPGSEHVVEAVGKVAWKSGGDNGGRAGVGVKFSRIDPKDLKLIVDYVNRVSRVVYSAT